MHTPRPSSSTPDDSLYVRVPTSRLRRKEHDVHRSLQSPSGQTAKLLVAVRTRPAEVASEGHARGERAERNATSSSTPNARARYSTSSTATSVRSSLNVRRMKSILRVVNRDTVVVMDPDEEKAYLDQVQRRSKARRYTFDVAFNELATNADVYEATGRGLISGVVNGMNSTVFAYGATGSGKTHTMIGNYDEPGMMFLSLVDIFAEIKSLRNDYEFEVTCSYLEVYNELIYDLLVVDSPPLELREDPERGPVPMGLTRIKVKGPDDITKLLHEGNERRSIDYTEANATSSRSHAVLEISVKRWEKSTNGKDKHVLCGKLSLVDLAGSERAADTQNSGQKLRDGGNINKSLLALANCINALGRHGNSKAKGRMYIPYRNSKLTRLLKDGLSGNSRTAMIATVSASSEQYNHTINTLKYANRAKEIKTNVAQNVVIARERHHIGDYQHVIDDLQSKVASLTTQLANKEEKASRASHPSAASGHSFSEAWLDALSDDINENVEERINIQKALFELEDINNQNVYERSALKRRLLQVTDSNPNNSTERRSLRGRIDDIDETIRANEALGAKYRKDVDANELVRVAIQSRIDAAIAEGKSTSFLRILSQYRLVGVKNMELHFQLAIRDQIISEQREMIRGLWEVMSHAGLSKAIVQDIASREGIRVDSARANISLGQVDDSHAPQDVPIAGISAQSSEKWHRAPRAEPSPRHARGKSFEHGSSGTVPASPLAVRRHPLALDGDFGKSGMTSPASRSRIDRTRPLSARSVSSHSSVSRDYVRPNARMSLNDPLSYIQRSSARQSPRRSPSEPRGSTRLIEARASRRQKPP